MRSYEEVMTGEDMEKLLDSIAGFHDSMMKEVHLIHRGAVLTDHCMEMSQTSDAQVLIQSQWPPFALELLFTNVKSFEMKGATDGYWGASGVVEDRHQPVVERTVTLTFDHSLKIVAERLHVRTRTEWLGNRPRFGPEVPAADAISARALTEGWRQCSRCADAWEEQPANEFSRCPGCGAITQLE